MAFALQQLQNTAHFIIERCRYDSGDTLTKSNKRWVFDELVAALYELATRDKPLIVVNPQNGALKSFFELLDTHKIIFPDATYIIRNGTECYQRHNGMRTDIYDHRLRHQRGYKEQVKAARSDLSDMASLDDRGLEDVDVKALSEKLGEVVLDDAKDRDFAADAIAVPSASVTYQRQALVLASREDASADGVTKDRDERSVSKSSVFL